MKPIALGESPVRAQALRAGLVDAISISSPFDLSLKSEGFRVLAGPQDVQIALPTSGLAVANRVLQQNPQIVKRAVRALMKSHRYVFENKKEVVPQMIRYLEQTPEVAGRSYDLLVTSLSRNGDHRSRMGHSYGRKEGGGRRARLLHTARSTERTED